MRARYIILSAAVMLFFVLQVQLAWLFRAHVTEVPIDQPPLKGLARGLDEGSWPFLDPDHPCGVVVVAMSGHFLGHPVTLSESRELLKPDERGLVSMAEIVESLQQLNLHAKGVYLSPAAYDFIEGLPVIVHLNDNHFSVVVAKGQSQVLMLDPPYRPEFLSVAQLSERGWSGAAIVVSADAGTLQETLRRIGVEVDRGQRGDFYLSRANRWIIAHRYSPFL